MAQQLESAPTEQSVEDAPTPAADARERIRRRLRRGERGAALVEMALILPVVVLLLFGVIEMSWMFAQANDLRHGAREGARLAAVNYGDVSAIGTEVCNRMDLADGTLIVTFGDGSEGDDDGARSSAGRVEVSLSPNSLTGMFDDLIGGNTISSDIEFVLEQPATPEALWWNDGDGGSHTCGS